MIQNIGVKEIMIIGLLIFFFFGGKKLNEMARGLGESAKEFKKVKKDLSAAEVDIKKSLSEIESDVKTNMDKVTDEIKDLDKKS